MAAQVEIEDQESVTKSDNDGEIFNPVVSDSRPSSTPNFSGGDNNDSTILLREDTLEHDLIKNCFISGMGSFSNETTIVSVRKNSTERRITTKAKFSVFKVFTEAVTRKNEGDANVKYGWYSGSKEEIDRIVAYGFSNKEIDKFDNDAGSHGVGIHLVHHRYSLVAALVGEGDEEGVKHVLLCRVILGKPEVIVAGSKQSCPSSYQFDSGVDNLENPRKYVIWSSTMNSYILPSYIVSFKSPRLRGLIGRARSPCVSFSVLMSILSKSLDQPRMNLILTTYDDFRKRKLGREQLVKKMREVVGDHLLFKILKNQRR
ncbi:PREDICTED: probable inactive poly [ADP-ribose] polymerase SRO3 [Camelina sativa]|uniref:Probable inactive poly [ADP-ribose] polymerase SRO3 n=1 Tax=Camelina sativa TaxID=90675 RepID=A0ABM0WH64_CAMSA|nr:PREDICTED: probable inactive poly [ADP-ribose] polymerase SRO3 [Camelina sativa]